MSKEPKLPIESKDGSLQEKGKNPQAHFSEPNNHLNIVGLQYLKHQITVFTIPIIFSIYTLIIQGINILFITSILGGLDPSHLPPPPPPPDQPPMIDQLTPALIIIIFAIFLIIKGRFLINLRKNIVQYEIHQKRNASLGNSETMEPHSNSERLGTDSGLTLTTIFYRVIGHMEFIQKLSICLYVVLIFYSQWYIRYFLMLFGFVPGALLNWDDFIFLLNFTNQILLLVYIIFDLRQFIKWNAKLKRLHVLEREIAQEFESVSE